MDAKTVQREQFDIIICLSTIKWVHLTFGDIGLKALLLKAKEQLAPGGLFVFDSQPWKSYKKALKEAKGAQPIELKPHCFKAYLKAIGLRLLHSIEETQDEHKLDKVIYVYVKA